MTKAEIQTEIDEARAAVNEAQARYEIAGRAVSLATLTLSEAKQAMREILAEEARVAAERSAADEAERADAVAATLAENTAAKEAMDGNDAAA